MCTCTCIQLLCVEHKHIEKVFELHFQVVHYISTAVADVTCISVA